MWLDRRKRNFLFNMIEDAGLDPGAFELSQIETEGSETWRLDHEATHSHFVMVKKERSVAGFAAVAKVGDGDYDGINHKSWETIHRQFRPWLDEIVHELNEPDLWAELRQTRELLESDSVVANSPFTSVEKTHIAQQLRKLRDDIAKNRELSADQLRLLDERLSYAEEAADRLGRVDWRNAVVGALLTLATEALVPPEAVRHVVVAIFHSLGHLFGHPVPGLPPAI
jgi:hypothetical protein